MAIKIGDVSSLGKAKNWQVIPDDRQTKVQLIDSPYNYVVDNGRRTTGDTYQFSAIFSSASWATLQTYWNNRTKVDVIPDSGETLTSRRVLVKSYTYVDGFEKNYVEVTIELWAV